MIWGISRIKHKSLNFKFKSLASKLSFPFFSPFTTNCHSRFLSPRLAINTKFVAEAIQDFLIFNQIMSSWPIRCSRNTKQENRLAAPQLRELASLAKDPHSVPSTQVEWFIITYKYSSRDPAPSSGLWRYLHLSAHTQTQTQIHIQN